MMRDPLRFVLVTVLGLSLWAPPPVARATQVLSKSAPAGLSPAPWLNLDGTLTVTEPAFGALDLAGYNVTVDASRGPIFSPETDSAAAVAPGQWDTIGTGLGALTGKVLAIAVMGTTVFVGGTFLDAANLPAADYVARWDGTQWSALGASSNGAGSLSSAVYALAVHGADLYAGGSFGGIYDGAAYLGAAARVAKWDGTHWSALGSNGANGPALGATVQSLAVDAAGNVYAGGWFTNVNNNGVVLPEADYIARWNGANWSAVGHNGAGDGALGNVVYALQFSGSDLFVGGGFTNVNNNGVSLPAADYIARWDGATWSALGSNGAANGAITNVVWSLTLLGTNLIVGGSFVNVNNQGVTLGAADYLAQWDGSNWSALGSNGAGNGALNSVVYSLTAIGNTLYIGGCFSNVNDAGTSLTAADGIARWDGSHWTALGSNGSGDGAIPAVGSCQQGVVSALASRNGQIIAGGNFVDVNNSGSPLPAADMLAIWDGTDWSAVGAVPNGSLNSLVQAVVVVGTDLYVGGGFTDVSDQGANLPAADYVARWDGSNWSALGSNGAGNGALNGLVYALAVDAQGNLYAGGGFTNVNDNGAALPAADYLARWDGTHWSALGDNGAGNGALNGSVTALAFSGSDLIVGGIFTNASNHGVSDPAADYLAVWDGTTWSALGSNGAGDGSLNNFVAALAVSGTDLYVGGWFTDVNNNGTLLTAADCIARWDGTDWSALGGDGAGGGSINDDPGSNGVRAILVDGSDVYVGGYFNNLNNQGVVLTAADSIARWDGSNWSALGNNGSGNGALFGGEVRAIVKHGSTLYVGGTHSAVNSSFAAGRVAQWNGVTWSSLSSNGSGGSPINHWVYALAVSGEDLIVAGAFDDVTQNAVAVAAADFLAAYGIGTDMTEPQIQAVTRLNPDPTYAGNVNFAVAFSENVTGVSAADFALQASGLTGAQILYVTGTNADYVVHIATGSGDGSVRLDVPGTATITDFAGNPLAGLPYTVGPTYTVIGQTALFLPSLAK
ncbi:MAG: hypothetical protein JNL73_03860 [Anaerolineales bacterium]|nr:hypothetical protein [Anaerolineales bacterium]